MQEAQRRETMLQEDGEGSKFKSSASYMVCPARQRLRSVGFVQACARRWLPCERGQEGPSRRTLRLSCSDSLYMLA